MATGNEVSGRSRRWWAVFEVSSTAAMVALAAALVWQNYGTAGRLTRGSTPSPVPVPKELVAIDSSPSLGVRSAPLVMIVYSDFQCRFCSRLALQTLPSLVREYASTGQLLIVFKHLPLEIHPTAPAVAAAAICAGYQGKFWQAHDALFADLEKQTESDLHALAATFNLDVATYKECRTGERAIARVNADKEEALAFEIKATPTIFIGKNVGGGDRAQILETLTGAKPLDAIKKVLDRHFE